MLLWFFRNESVLTKTTDFLIIVAIELMRRRIVLVILCYFSVGYSYELYGASSKNINMSNVEA